jgi:hypothetical protein
MRLPRLGILWLLGSGPQSGMKESGDVEHELLLCPVAMQRKASEKAGWECRRSSK